MSRRSLTPQPGPGEARLRPFRSEGRGGGLPPLGDGENKNQGRGFSESTSGWGRMALTPHFGATWTLGLCRKGAAWDREARGVSRWK